MAYLKAKWETVWLDILILALGRIVKQNLTIITKSIEDGDFFSIKEFNDAIENVQNNNKKLHILGLLSDGGIHSHQRHLYALLELCKRKGLDNNIFVHAFLDGRDTLPASRRNIFTTIRKCNG